MKQLPTHLPGCGAHGCAIKKPEGQGTNGGCLCRPAALQDMIDQYQRAWNEQQERITELERQTAERDEAYRITISERCAQDEQHCACVPHLRQRITELERELSDYRQSSARHDRLLRHHLAALREIDEGPFPDESVVGFANRATDAASEAMREGGRVDV